MLLWLFGKLPLMHYLAALFETGSPLHDV